ncbi:MAG: histidine kinase dimerization/phospho-acceptor domain-containing protein [Kiritimatiellia bacterium]
MNKDLLFYFLVMLAPLVLLPFATHRLLTQELNRGKALGQAYLQTKAELVAGQMRAAGTDTLPAADADGALLLSLVDPQGRPLDASFPVDGRCQGEAAVAPGRAVRVVWAGTPSPGARRRRKLVRAQICVWTGSGLIFLTGLGLLIRAVFRARREAREQLEYVDGFSHRLKTPLTSISLCAELARSKRLPADMAQEATATIASETAKLNGLVDEVLAYIGARRHG